MQITKYKNIEDLIIKKEEYLGREIEKRDLALIDKGYSPTTFNIGINDVMEFALYDSANNVLEQERYGMIRYIKGNDIAQYLLRSENIDDKTSGGGFLIDIKRLIKEAGYNTGYFRVQINFSNNRVGSDYPKDKLWIQEISPSKKEVRLLPFNNFDETNPVDRDVKNDLNQAYDSFVRGKFSGDEVYMEIDTILDRLNENDIANMLSSRFSADFINGIKREFGLTSLESFYSLVLNDMRKAVRYHLLYRDSTIGGNRFGKPLSDTAREKISELDYNYYTKEDIINLLNRKFRESVEYHLPKRNLNEQLTIDPETKASLDELNKFVQTLSSTTTFGLPAIQKDTYIPPVDVPPTEEIPNPVDDSPPDDITPIPTPVNPTFLDFTVWPNSFSITKDSAIITWKTNIPSTATLTFLDRCPADGCVFYLDQFNNKQSITITKLAPYTTYNYIIECVTETGLVVKSTVTSFTTLGESSKINITNEQNSSNSGYVYTDTTTPPVTRER
jgi:hypothetical protein